MLVLVVALTIDSIVGSPEAILRAAAEVEEIIKSLGPAAILGREPGSTGEGESVCGSDKERRRRKCVWK